MRDHRFYRYELRTTDEDAGQAFYAAVFGPAFWRPGLSTAPLPPTAAARGS
jgi:hypothetical protein